MLQKIIKVGNSLAVTLPKSFADRTGIRAGDEVAVETNESIKAIYIRHSDATGSPGLTPEFKEWLDEVSTKEAAVIKSLAKV